MGAIWAAAGRPRVCPNCDSVMENLGGRQLFNCQRRFTLQSLPEWTPGEKNLSASKWATGSSGKMKPLRSKDSLL